MNFLIWYGIGVTTIIITLFIESYRCNPKNRRIRRSFYELYQIFYKKADAVSTVVFVVAALLGPMLPVIFVYLIARNWYNGLPTDEDNKKIFPWSND